jgi:hypothetical protein
LRLTSAPTAVVLASHCRDHVQQHAVNRLEHPERADYWRVDSVTSTSATLPGAPASQQASINGNGTAALIHHPVAASRPAARLSTSPTRQNSNSLGGRCRRPSPEEDIAAYRYDRAWTSWKQCGERSQAAGAIARRPLAMLLRDRDRDREQGPHVSANDPSRYV